MERPLYTLLVVGLGLIGAPGCDTSRHTDHAMVPDDLTVRTLPITCEPTIQAYPVAGPHNGGYDSNALDYTCHPHPGTSPDNTDYNAGVHIGNDLFAAKGTPVVSPLDGTIYNVGTITVGGNRVTVQGPCGWLYYHAHLDTIQPGLSAGMSVSAGQLIGTVGNTGNAINTSPHVHFSIYPPGDYNAGVDPFPYLQAADSTACEGGTVSPDPPVDPEPPVEPLPTEPDVTLWTELTPPPGQLSDFRAEGTSEGVTDLLEGQGAAVEVWVHNAEDAAIAGDVVVGVDFHGANLSPLAWAVYTDYPAQDQSTWSWNDANDHPSNPSASGPPFTGAWHLYGFSPGETKRLVFEFEATAYSIGAEVRPEVRAWVWHVDDWYGEQVSWDDPVELNVAGEILRAAHPVDVYSDREWHFEGEGAAETEGWVAGGGASNAEVAQGALVADASGANPHLMTETAGFSAELYTGVRIGASVLGVGSSRLFFSTDTAPGFDESRSVSLELSPDGGAQVVEAYLADNPSWQGTVTGLRFDLPDAGASAVAVDFVEAAFVTPPPPNIDPPEPEDPPEDGTNPSPDEPGSGVQPGTGPCVPGGVTSCVLAGGTAECSLGVMTCLESAMWGLCLESDACGEGEPSAEEPTPEVTGEPSVPTVAGAYQRVRVEESRGASGCAGGTGGGAPLLALLVALSVLWRRGRTLVCIALIAGLTACSGSDEAGLNTEAVTYADSTNGGWGTVSDVGGSTADVTQSPGPRDDVPPRTDDSGTSPVTEDAGPVPDPGGGALCTTPNDVGCECQDDGDCAVGLECLGSLCVGPCPQNCLDGWVCVDSMQLCVPPHAMLCAPCSEDSDCLTPDATCVSLGVAGSYCGTPCTANTECPEGFACQALGTGADAPKRCLPPGEACGCSGIATEVGAATGCHVEVGGTLCAGTRACGPDGLSACEATGEEGPSCGGTDPDPDPDPDPVTCDGVICDDDNPCTDDHCLEGECSYMSNTAACDDGNACTAGDICQGGFCQSGTLGVETCNGLDDDCDGSVDEGLTQSCTTACGAGSETCVDGGWVGCSAPTLVCDPAEPCCGVDGCGFLASGTLCGSSPLSVQSACDGSCGGSVLLTEEWPTCDGVTAECGAGAPMTVDAGVSQTCAAEALCVDADAGASCSDCAFGCSDGACSELQEEAHVVCIDPGYGGTDPGPAGNGSTGAVVTWALASHLVAWLEADTADPSGGASWTVVLTRGENEDPEWADRSAACNAADAERLLAIYSNAFNGAADGSETHFRSEDGADAELLATLVQSELIEHGDLDDRGVIDETWLILSGTDAPGAMTFVGFLDNAGDGALMVQDSWRQEVAKGFMHALQQSFGAEPYTP